MAGRREGAALRVLGGMHPKDKALQVASSAVLQPP